MRNHVRSCVGVAALAIGALCGASFDRAAAQEVPEENRKEMVQALGAPFVVFREPVLEELLVSEEQRANLMRHAMDQLLETGPFLDSLRDAGPEREKKLEAHRKDAREQLSKCLKDVLRPDQRKRLREIVLQREGAFALGQEEVRAELKITPEQSRQFQAIIQDLQARAEKLIKAAQAGDGPAELPSKIEQLRQDHAKQLEGVLTDAQKKRWKELLGPPFELAD